MANTVGPGVTPAKANDAAPNAAAPIATPSKAVPPNATLVGTTT